MTDVTFTVRLFLEEAATEMIFMEIISCCDSHHTVMIFSFLFSLLWALFYQSVCLRIGVSLTAGYEADSEP